MTFDPELGMPLILALIVLGIGWGLLRRWRNGASRINLDDLLLDDVTGKTSPSRAVLIGSFALTTWTIVYLTLSGKLTEGFFGLYVGGWVAPAVAKIIKGATNGEPK